MKGKSTLEAMAAMKALTHLKMAQKGKMSIMFKSANTIVSTICDS